LGEERSVGGVGVLVALFGPYSEAVLKKPLASEVLGLPL